MLLILIISTEYVKILTVSGRYTWKNEIIYHAVTFLKIIVYLQFKLTDTDLLKHDLAQRIQKNIVKKIFFRVRWKMKIFF